MGYNPDAVLKGLKAECLAKFYYMQKGYSILNPEGHETSFDFVAYSKNKNKFIRVQVKSDRGNQDLVRFSNKRGGSNSKYLSTDYDILIGVWVEKLRVYLFHSYEVNNSKYGTELTVERKDGKPLLKRDRAIPFEVSDLTH